MATTNEEYFVIGFLIIIISILWSLFGLFWSILLVFTILILVYLYGRPKTKIALQRKHLNDAVTRVDGSSEDMDKSLDVPFTGLPSPQSYKPSLRSPMPFLSPDVNKRLSFNVSSISPLLGRGSGLKGPTPLMRSPVTPSSPSPRYFSLINPSFQQQQGTIKIASPDFTRTLTLTSPSPKYADTRQTVLSALKQSSTRKRSVLEQEEVEAGVASPDLHTSKRRKYHYRSADGITDEPGASDASMINKDIEEPPQPHRTSALHQLIAARLKRRPLHSNIVESETTGLKDISDTERKSKIQRTTGKSLPEVTLSKAITDDSDSGCDANDDDDDIIMRDAGFKSRKRKSSTESTPSKPTLSQTSRSGTPRLLSKKQRKLQNAGSQSLGSKQSEIRSLKSMDTIIESPKISEASATSSPQTKRLEVQGGSSPGKIITETPSKRFTVVRFPSAKEEEEARRRPVPVYCASVNSLDLPPMKESPQSLTSEDIEEDKKLAWQRVQYLLNGFEEDDEENEQQTQSRTSPSVAIRVMNLSSPSSSAANSIITTTSSLGLFPSATVSITPISSLQPPTFTVASSSSSTSATTSNIASSAPAPISSTASTTTLLGQQGLTSSSFATNLVGQQTASSTPSTTSLLGQQAVSSVPFPTNLLSQPSITSPAVSSSSSQPVTNLFGSTQSSASSNFDAVPLASRPPPPYSLTPGAPLGSQGPSILSQQSATSSTGFESLLAMSNQSTSAAAVSLPATTFPVASTGSMSAAAGVGFGTSSQPVAAGGLSFPTAATTSSAPSGPSGFTFGGNNVTPTSALPSNTSLATSGFGSKPGASLATLAFGSQAPSRSMPNAFGAASGKLSSTSAGGLAPSATTAAAPSLFGSSSVSAAQSSTPSAGGFTFTSSKPNPDSSIQSSATTGFSFASNTAAQQKPGTKQDSTSAFGVSQTASNNLFGAASAQNTFGASSLKQNTFGRQPTSQGAFDTSTNLGAFGAPTPTPSSFGSSTAPQTAFGGQGVPQNTGNAFGAPAASQNAFGASAVPQSAFGAPAASQNAFGAPAASQNAFGSSTTSQNAFGAKTTAQNTFGGASTQNTFAFGASSAVPKAFGRFSQASTPAPQGGGFGKSSSGTSAFGPAAAGSGSQGPFASTAVGGQGIFGAAKPAPQPTPAPTAGGFSFGNPAAPAATTGGFKFGASSPAPSGFTFGSASPAAPAFGQQATAAPGFGSSPAPASGGFNFTAGTSSPAGAFAPTTPTPAAGAAASSVARFKARASSARRRGKR
ncbi:mucin-19 isoform X2 [Nematostella vectensis]|uniref:mucin-19 isoform X2 n=1 Tax=Nematostella vectensis TaxID=45351 RepID=UPI002077165F|nr:mucin-19 isoform X2 [Nematostella vectensis]